MQRLGEAILTGLGFIVPFIDESGCQSASLQRSMLDESRRGVAC